MIEINKNMYSIFTMTFKPKFFINFLLSDIVYVIYPSFILHYLIHNMLFIIFQISKITSNTVSSTTLTHSSIFFLISFPQNRITVHPSNNNFLLISSSRSRFRDILLIQYSPLLLFSNRGFKTSQSFP